MRNRKVVLGCLGVMSLMATASLRAAPRAERPNEGLLPTSVEESSELTFEYRLVPPVSFTVANGELTARWDTSRFEVSDVVLAADFEATESVVTGRATPFVLHEEAHRYDLMGWMKDRTTGERFRFASPLWTPAGYSRGEPSVVDLPQTCTLTEDVECPDGSRVSVTCSGENGTCFSCSLSKSACCRASNRESMESASGRVQELLVINQESLSCPPPPQPRPGDPSRPRGFQR